MNPPQDVGTGAGKANRPTEVLTRREREICGLIASGRTNLDIAGRLRISVKTVESHRKKVMTKLGLRRRFELVRYALEHGLLEGFQAAGLFKHCPACQAKWYFRGAFLADPEISFVGYRPVNGSQQAGLLIFAHARCGASLPCPLEWFQELTGQPLLADSCVVSGTKGEQCLVPDASSPCPLRCVCAFVWHTSRIIQNWPKVLAPT